jgi:hypothetical protein
MKKILYYYLSYRPGGNGRIVFRLDGETQNRWVDLNSTDFSALAAVLTQKRITYDTETNTFISYDDDNLPMIETNQIE